MKKVQPEDVLDPSVWHGKVVGFVLSKFSQKNKHGNRLKKDYGYVSTDDLIQEALIVLYMEHDKYDPVKSKGYPFGAWMLRRIYQRCIDVIRKGTENKYRTGREYVMYEDDIWLDFCHNRHRRNSRSVYPFEASDLSWKNIRKQATYRCLIRKLVPGISDYGVKILYMYYTLDMSDPQIACELGKKTPTVSQNRWRALDKLRRLCDNIEANSVFM